MTLLNKMSFHSTILAEETSYCLEYLKLCNYQEMKVNMKSQKYEWPVKLYKKKNQKGQAPLIPDLPEKC